MIKCPCCGQYAANPTPDLITVHAMLAPTERDILSTLWRANGQPVAVPRLADVIYSARRNGGPAPHHAARNVKLWVFRLRQKLTGTGIGVAAGPYGDKTYRIIIGSAEHDGQ